MLREGVTNVYLTVRLILRVELNHTPTPLTGCPLNVFFKLSYLGLVYCLIKERNRSKFWQMLTGEVYVPPPQSVRKNPLQMVLIVGLVSYIPRLYIIRP